MINKYQKCLIVENLDRNEALKELKKLNNEFGIALSSGTLINGEGEKIEKRMCELMCIVEFLDILQGGD